MEMKQIKRDKQGLLANVDYEFTEDGLIDWRKMIKTEYLVPDKNKTSETNVEKLKDYQLIILLGGIKELAQIRGYSNVNYDVTTPSPDYVVAVCSITWTPNYETEGKEVTFSAIGDASSSNTKDFARYFLGPIAENRAFVRCVRNFLKINIVGKEELGPDKLGASNNMQPPTENSTDPRYVLGALMKKKSVTFEQILSKLKKEVEEEKWTYKKIDNIKTIEDIPKIKAFELVGRLQKFKGK